MSTTPAPSPGPTSTHGAVVGNRGRCARDDLYEQCSDHITAYIASSRSVGSRWSSATTAASSSSVIPSWRCNGRSITTETSEHLALHRSADRLGSCARDAHHAPAMREDAH